MQGTANGHGVTGDDVEHTRRNARLLSQHREGKCRQRGFFRGFKDHGATGRERRTDFAGDHCQREVPRGDGRHHTNRFLGHDDACIRFVARDHVAIGALGFFAEPLQKTRGIDHFAHRFGQGFALFQAQQLGQVLLVAEHQVAPALEALAALLGGELAPGRQSPVGGMDGQVGGLRAGALDVCNQGAIGRVEHRVGRSTAGPLAIYVVASTDQRVHATASIRLKRSRPGRASRRMRLPAV